MDRRVKERLVGATILVVLVVLIVPELLSGPKRASSVQPTSPAAAAAAIRSVTVDLATNKATAANPEPAAAAASAVVEAPAAGAAGDTLPDANSTTDASAGAGEPAGADRGSASGATSPAPPPLPTPLESGAASSRSGQAVKAEGVHHGWVAQLGSFAARTNAEKLERQLRAQGFAPFVSSAGAGRALRYRVRVGPVADRAAAEKVIARLQKAGHAASVVAL